MQQRHSVQNIIDDLVKFGKLSEGLPKEIPEEAVRYLLLNYHPIEYCLKSVYEEMSEAERDELRKSQKELHYSVSNDKAREIVSQPLTQLKHYYAGVGDITKDNLTMLIRALRYAKFRSVPFLFLFRNP